jgi:hypothetical protein
MVTYDPSVQEMLVRAQDRFVWETKLYPTYPRGPRWYFIITAGALLLVSYAVITSNFLFAFLILLCAIIIVLAGNEEAPVVLAQVGDVGVVWNGNLFLYRDLTTFSIVYEPPYISTLYIDTKSLTQPKLRISLEDQDPAELRAHLRAYLKENTDLQTEPGSDILGRLLRI